MGVFYLPGAVLLFKRAVVEILFLYPIYRLSGPLPRNLRRDCGYLYGAFQHLLPIANTPESDCIIRQFLVDTIDFYNLLFVFIVYGIVYYLKLFDFSRKAQVKEIHQNIVHLNIPRKQIAQYRPELLLVKEAFLM